MQKLNDEILDREALQKDTTNFRRNAFRFSVYSATLQFVLIYEMYPEFYDISSLFRTTGATIWMIFLWLGMLATGTFLLLAFRQMEEHDFRYRSAFQILSLLVFLQVLGLLIPRWLMWIH